MMMLGQLQPGAHFIVPWRSDKTRGILSKTVGWAAADVLIDGEQKTWSAYTEVVPYSPEREALWHSVPEEFHMPVLEWQKKKGADIHRAIIEERMYLIEKFGKSYACNSNGDRITTGTLDQCKTKAQQHLNKTPPPKVTTVMAIVIAKRAARLGMDARAFCADKKLLNELILDGLGVSEAVIKQAERWQREHAGNVQNATVKASRMESRPQAQERADSAPRSRPGTGRGGYKILGYASLGVIHWCAAQGFTLEQTKRILHAHGVTSITDENLRHRWMAGKNPKRSKPASLTMQEQKQLRREAGVKK